MEKMKIEYIPITELVEYENNAKIHTDEQIEQIKESIVEFGMNDPIGIWKDNVVIEGHGRLIACKELGYAEVPVIRLDHLSDEQRKAYGLVHNKLTMNTDFDIEILGFELEEIEMDMSVFGFEDDFQIEETPTEQKEIALGEENYQIIIDCVDENDCEEIYNKLQEIGIECRISTL